MEGGTPVRIGFKPNLTTMLLDDTMGDKEPQPRAVGLNSHGILGPKETVEDILALIVRDADAAVFDRDLDKVPRSLGTDLDLATDRSVLDSILKEILQYRAHLLGVDKYVWQRLVTIDERHPELFF